MKSLLIEIEDELADRLERIAPMGSRRCSEFARSAILKALREAEGWTTLEDHERPLDPELSENRAEECTKQLENMRNFLVRFAHELITPLSTAEQHVQFVEAIVQGDKRVRDPQEHINFIRDNLAYLSYLVRDIQLQATNLGLRDNYDFSRPVDMRPMIEKVKRLLLPRARIQRAIDIRTKTYDLPALFVDRIRMEQVVFNLLDNAIKYSMRGSRDIVVEYGRREERLEGYPGLDRWHCIFVQSWGIGVEEGEEEEIFKEYYRGSNTHHAPSGTGLGLPVSKRIIESHGGALRLTQRQWPTVFAVFLPAYLEERKPFSDNTFDR